MALTTKSGALWQMSRAEKDEGWTDEGHAFVGREVVRSTSATAQSVGTIYCWLPPTVEDCYEDEDGKPAPLFKVRFLVGELDGDVEDLDIRQVVESLVTESVLRPPEPPKPTAKPKPKKSPRGRNPMMTTTTTPPRRRPSRPRTTKRRTTRRRLASPRRRSARRPRRPSPRRRRRRSANPRRSPRHRSPRAAAPAPKVKPEPAPAPRPKAPAKPSGRPGAERATARYAWEPLRDNQLALAAGDNLEVWPTNESWWFARNARTGAEGRVMSGHVKVGPWHEDEDDDDAPAPAPVPAPAPPPAPKVKAEPAPAPAPAPKKKEVHLGHVLRRGRGAGARTGSGARGRFGHGPRGGREEGRGRLRLPARVRRRHGRLGHGPLGRGARARGGRLGHGHYVDVNF